MLISKFGGENIDDKIEILEDVMENNMPEQLQIFLKKYNGGETPNTKFSCNGVSSDVKGFYGVGEVKYSYDDIKALGYKGDVYLPVAFDSFGNEILISLETGIIFFRNHENGGIKKLAVDLREFIKHCESTEINLAARKSVEEREIELIKRGRGNIVTDALREMWKAEINKYASINQEEVNI